MDYGLKGRSVIVTGASKGIGRATGLAFAREGANVVLFARGAHEVERAAGDAKDLPGTALAIAGDVTKAEDRERLVKTTVDRFGGIDVLVNNAGSIGAFAPFEDLTLENWRALFELNLFSVVGLIQLVLPHMRKVRRGRIINISSESAVQPDPVMNHYNASKAALNNLTKSLSKAVGADGILVNAVAPAFIKTPLVEEMLANLAREHGTTPAQAEQAFLKENRPNIVLGRAGTSEESAEAVLFLASDQASFITGSVLRVDGGSVATVSI
ncbi:MAG TPA: glucose 1-dehydrogenase [Candidatus Baltobacteraceae bacterium]|nr:glucose 1-dehydrogenase [Candidatus Baltobacteraceae bacterium]